MVMDKLNNNLFGGTIMVGDKYMAILPIPGCICDDGRLVVCVDDSKTILARGSLLRLNSEISWSGSHIFPDDCDISTMSWMVLDGRLLVTVDKKCQ